MIDYKISGCIVTYNNKKIVGRTIESVLAYTANLPFELFVVDNASTDGTAQYIKENYPAVTVIQCKTNSGFGAGHNKVIPFLDSKYHIVINPDIIIDSDVIMELAEYADKHPDVGLISPKIVFEDGREQLLGKKNPTFRFLAAHRFAKEGEISSAMREYCMLDMPQGEPFEITNATGCFMFFRTDVFKDLGGFDERFFMYLEDCDIARRVSEKSKAIYYPLASVCHLWQRESKKNKKLLIIHLKSILQYFLKWGFF